MPWGTSGGIVLSVEERESQRRNLEEAARRRETAWDKKLEKNRNKKREDNGNKSLVAAVDMNEENNPEVLRLVQAAKRREDEVVRQMGFSPFQPHMSFSSGSNSVAEVKSTTNTTSLQDKISIGC
jgi:hypothetical protein